MKVKIEIDTRTFVRFWLVVIGFALAAWMIYSAREALMIIGTSLFLAVALNSPVRKIASKLPGKSRLGGTAIAFVSILVIITAVIWFVVPPLVQQSAKFAENLPHLIDRAGEQWHGLGKLIDENGLRPQVNTAVEGLKTQATEWAASVGSNILSGIGSLASFLAASILVIVLTFLMLLEGEEWMQRIWSLYRDKDKREHHKMLVSRVYGVVTGYVTGQLTISGIGALFAGLFVFILSFFFPDLNANLAMPTILITFILVLVPMFGSTLAGAVVGLMLMLNAITPAIIYVIYFVIYQQIENNFIAPTIQAKKVELSALAILVAVTVGLYVGGLVGGVIAIPIAGSIKVFLDDYITRDNEKHARRKRSPLKKLLKRGAEADEA
ncbi:MAG: AI-2E family transporter [Candidatus Saccharibacteria bacterium]|nr:AI-2E family transporter [Candidatus Saccharibacteria bacterium]